METKITTEQQLTDYLGKIKCRVLVSKQKSASEAAKDHESNSIIAALSQLIGWSRSDDDTVKAAMDNARQIQMLS